MFLISIFSLPSLLHLSFHFCPYLSVSVSDYVIYVDPNTGTLVAVLRSLKAPQTHIATCQLHLLTIGKCITGHYTYCQSFLVMDLKSQVFNNQQRRVNPCCVYKLVTLHEEKSSKKGPNWEDVRRRIKTHYVVEQLSWLLTMIWKFFSDIIDVANKRFASIFLSKKLSNSGHGKWIQTVQHIRRGKKPTEQMLLHPKQMESKLWKREVWIELQELSESVAV